MTYMAVPQLVQRSATLPYRERGARYAVIADTHSAPHEATAWHVAALRPDAILHAGDIGDHAVIAGFAEIAPVFAVRGNIDVQGEPDVLVLQAGALRILLLHIGVVGPKLRGDAAKLARGAGAQLVVCGHSHVPFIGIDRGIHVFNPGSCGPRRFTLPIVFGTIDVSPHGVKLAHREAATGEPWLPP